MADEQQGDKPEVSAETMFRTMVADMESMADAIRKLAANQCKIMEGLEEHTKRIQQLMDQDVQLAEAGNTLMEGQKILKGVDETMATAFRKLHDKCDLTVRSIQEQVEARLSGLERPDDPDDWWQNGLEGPPDE